MGKIDETKSARYEKKRNKKSFEEKKLLKIHQQQTAPNS